MIKPATFNLNELLISLSNAMDLASPVLMKHQQRTAYVAWRVAENCNLDHRRREDLFLAAILHDIGALTTDEKVDLHESETVNPNKHCVLGYRIYNQVAWMQPAAEIVLRHHKPWCEYTCSLEQEFTREAQILYLSDVLERMIDKQCYILYQCENLKKEIQKLEGVEIHPDVIRCFLRVAESDEFWLDIVSPRLDIILGRLFTKRSIYLTLDEMQNVALLFKNIIDFRTPYTAAHSSGVAACASKIAECFGFSEEEVVLMEIAGDLHDIGKLAISNKILDKKDKLTEKEFAIIRQHVYYTYQIFNGVSGFEQIMHWAILHHEKLDGSGYPFSLIESEIPMGARILVVADVFAALSEDRPYRKAMKSEEIKLIMDSMVRNNKLDAKVVQVLYDNLDKINEKIYIQKEIALERYKAFTDEIELD